MAADGPFACANVTEGVVVHKRREKNEICKKELQEFDSRHSVKMRQVIEGQLYKYTNVIKGWQYRWFVLDPETGMLDYYMMDETEKTPRGSVQLAGAVISPSDEDSQTFTVNTAYEEVYRLRASDAKERQYWVDKLREVSEHQIKIIAKQYPPIRFASSDYVCHLDADSVIGKLKGEPVTKEKEFIHESFNSVWDMLLQTERHQQNLKLAIDEAYHTGTSIKAFNMELLMLKATANAAKLCLDQCFAILQRMQMDYDVNKNLPVEEGSSSFESKASDSTIYRTNSFPLLMRAESAGIKTSQNDLQDTDVAGEISDDESEAMIMESEVEYDKPAILQLLSQLKLGMDLTKVNFPTFLLEPFSLLEMYANFMRHPDYFLRIADETTPESRMIAVVEWYLTSIHLGRRGSVAKKPYNPVLGETFRCSWRVPKQHENNITHFTVTFVAEQVSHFPPISAFYIECQKKKIYAEAHICAKSKFLGMSIGINLIGEGNIHLLTHNEVYNFTLPSAFARSVPSVPWMELGGRVIITCNQSGCSGFITFHTNPFYGDKLHRISTEIKDAQGEIICKGNGQWNGEMTFTYTNGRIKCIDVHSILKYRKRLRPPNHQDSSESRKIWHNVTEALKKGDVVEASHHKHQIEIKQREDEDRQSISKTKYQGKLFQQKDNAWIYKYPLVYQ